MIFGDPSIPRDSKIFRDIWHSWIFRNSRVFEIRESFQRRFRFIESFQRFIHIHESASDLPNTRSDETFECYNNNDTFNEHKEQKIQWTRLYFFLNYAHKLLNLNLIKLDGYWCNMCLIESSAKVHKAQGSWYFKLVSSHPTREAYKRSPDKLNHADCDRTHTHPRYRAQLMV